MLSAEKNDRLTRVGPGTPTGELPRRWWPIATHDMAARQGGVRGRVGRRSERSRVRGAPGGRARLRDYVDGQDIVAWITQGRISDRSREHLGRSDLGVILLRKLYAQERWN